MKWKSFFLGAAVGLIGGYAARELVSNQTLLPADRVLQKSKRLFKENGPIYGSWIQMKAEPFERNQISYQVYKGGISRMNNGEKEQFEFIADACTGTILEVRHILPQQ